MKRNVSVIKAIEPYLEHLKAIRQDIHAHPEMGMEEERTSALVATKLREWGIETHEGIGKTGVVGVIKGNRPGGKMIGLRADMDALPIHEETNLPYASKNPGVMHACGHDGHTTMLLGAARYLSEHRDFAGTVILIFQPAEEGRGGSRAMVKDGLFEKFPCQSIYAIHNRPGMPVGMMAARPGPVTANCDRWRITFKGTGGHGGGTPHLATDVTVVAGHFLLGVQTIVSRNVASKDVAVISVGYAKSGSDQAPNVMPAEFAIGGVCRTNDNAVRDILIKRMKELGESLAAAHNCSFEINYYQTGWAVINGEAQAKVASAAARSVVGEENFIPDLTPSTGGEDFAEMLHVVPGCFAHLGNGGDEPFAAPRLHTPQYDFNDEAIPYGVAYWAAVVEQELGAPG